MKIKLLAFAASVFLFLAFSSFTFAKNITQWQNNIIAWFIGVEVAVCLAMNVSAAITYTTKFNAIAKSLKNKFKNESE